jgi:hypothetical protein
MKFVNLYLQNIKKELFLQSNLKMNIITKKY